MEQHQSHDATTVDSLKSWLIDWMVREMGIDRSTIDPRQAFLSYGMDSVQAMTMVGDLEAKLGLRLPPTLAWDYPDVDALSAHLADQLNTTPQARSQPQPSHAASPGKIESVLAELETIGDRESERPLNPYVESTQER